MCCLETREGSFDEQRLFSVKFGNFDCKPPPLTKGVSLLGGLQTKNPQQEHPSWKLTPTYWKTWVCFSGGSFLMDASMMGALTGEKTLPGGRGSYDQLEEERKKQSLRNGDWSPHHLNWSFPYFTFSKFRFILVNILSVKVLYFKDSRIISHISKEERSGFAEQGPTLVLIPWFDKLTWQAVTCQQLYQGIWSSGVRSLMELWEVNLKGIIRVLDKVIGTGTELRIFLWKKIAGIRPVKNCLRVGEGFCEDFGRIFKVSKSPKIESIYMDNSKYHELDTSSSPVSPHLDVDNHLIFLQKSVCDGNSQH